MNRIESIPWGFVGLLMTLAGCTSTELKPVDIYPEDACSQCRMAVSDRSFASEIITGDHEILKFDDLGCLETYRKKNPQVSIRAMFVSDYETKQWIRYEKGFIVETGLVTPMGSGKVAFSDSKRASAFAKANPPSDVSEAEAGCSCCSLERSGTAANDASKVSP